MSLRFGLIGVFLAPEHVGYCFYHDADVEQESPVLNIPQVSSYPAFHLGKFFGFSPVAGDLRPSGNSDAAIGIENLLYLAEQIKSGLMSRDDFFKLFDNKELISYF